MFLDLFVWIPRALCCVGDDDVRCSYRLPAISLHVKKRKQGLKSTSCWLWDRLRASASNTFHHQRLSVLATNYFEWHGNKFAGCDRSQLSTSWTNHQTNGNFHSIRNRENFSLTTCVCLESSKMFGFVQEWSHLTLWWDEGAKEESFDVFKESDMARRASGVLMVETNRAALSVHFLSLYLNMDRRRFQKREQLDDVNPRKKKMFLVCCSCCVARWFCFVLASIGFFYYRPGLSKCPSSETSALSWQVPNAYINF